MTKKLTGRALAKFESERNVWQEVLDGVLEIKAGKGRRTKVKAKSHVVRVRLKSGLSQAQFAVALGVSKRTLEQWRLSEDYFYQSSVVLSDSRPTGNSLRRHTRYRHGISRQPEFRRIKRGKQCAESGWSRRICRLHALRNTRRKQFAVQHRRHDEW